MRVYVVACCSEFLCVILTETLKCSVCDQKCYNTDVIENKFVTAIGQNEKDQEEHHKCTGLYRHKHVYNLTRPLLDIFICKIKHEKY